MTKGATLTSPRTYLTQNMWCMLARCLQLWFSGSVTSVTQGAQQPCKSLLGLSGKGLVAREGTITFPCGDSNLGSLQGQEPQGSWCLWPSHAESRNVEPLSCNSPLHLDRYFKKKKGKGILSQTGANLHFYNLSPGFPSLSLRHMSCIKDFFSFPSLTFPFHFVGHFRPTN